MKLIPGQQFPPLRLQTFTGQEVTLPVTNAPFTHIQFRRFADCPICNLHLRGFAQQKQTLLEAGIHEVIFFHSSTQELKRYQDQLPFDCIADPDRHFYRQFEVEPSWKALISWQALSSAWREVMNSKRWWRHPDNGLNGLPADILLNPQGRILAVKYGTHADDQWSLAEVIELSRDTNGAPDVPE